MLIKVHQLNGYLQTIYLAEYEHKLLLLDGGCSCDCQLVVNYIKHNLKRDLAQLKLVLVSHMHPDHAGGAHRLRKLTGCKIASANCNKQWYAGIAGFAQYLIDMALAHWLAKKLNKKYVNLFYNPYLKVDYKLNDGQQLPIFTDWQVLYTTGHTDRDLSFYHQQSKSIYSADLIIKTKRGLIAPFPIYYPKSYSASLQQVKKLDIDCFYLAHGGAKSISQSELAELIKEHATNSKRTFKLAIYRRIYKFLSSLLKIFTKT